MYFYGVQLFSLPTAVDTGMHNSKSFTDIQGVLVACDWWWELPSESWRPLYKGSAGSTVLGFASSPVSQQCWAYIHKRFKSKHQTQTY